MDSEAQLGLRLQGVQNNMDNVAWQPTSLHGQLARRPAICCIRVHLFHGAKDASCLLQAKTFSLVTKWTELRFLGVWRDGYFLNVK